MQTQQLFIPFNLSCKSQALRLQKPGLAIFACAFMLSYGNMTQADTTTGAKAVSDTTESRVKSKSKTHKKKSAVNSKARKNEQTVPILKEGEGLSKNSKESVSTVKAKSKSIKSDTVELKEMVVTSGRAKNLLGLTGSASQGEVSQAQFEYRPLARNGELVELIPGTIATQHSGSGKANQYFLRGYNLDHGTDFTTIVDGIPMNMPTNRKAAPKPSIEALPLRRNNATKGSHSQMINALPVAANRTAAPR